MADPSSIRLSQDQFAAELLCRALNVNGMTQDWLRALSQVEKTALCSTAIQYGFGPLLDYTIRNSGQIDQLPVEARDELRKRFLRSIGECLHRQRHLSHLLEAFKVAGIPVIVLKGAHLAETVYPYPALRSMSDLDLLVPKTELSHVTQVLGKLGYRPYRKFWVEHETKVSHQLPGFLAPGGFPVEIHWTIILPELPYLINPADLWKRAISIPISGHQALGLSPEDLLLHLCIHAAAQHHLTGGLRLVYDIALVLNHYRTELDWNSLIQRTIDWRAESPICLMFLLSQRLFGVYLPDSFLEFSHAHPLEPEVQAVALELLFTSQDTGTRFSQQLALMLSIQGLKEKSKFIWQRIFLPPETMATVYPALPGSVGLLKYYPLRFLTLLKRHAISLWRIFRKESAALTAASRSQTIYQKEKFLLDKILQSSEVRSR